MARISIGKSRWEDGYTGDMDRTWLVQRLNRPHKATGPLGADNPFAFGGGYRNGGLSDDAMDLLRPIFGFDYMGAAEFEFGAVPQALSVIAKQADANELEAWQFTMPLTGVKPDFRDKTRIGPRVQTDPIYVLAKREWHDEVQARIVLMAKHGYEADLKEATWLDRALRPDPNNSDLFDRVKGWLELNNGFMFFVDRDMWAATCALFGVNVEANA